MNSYEILTAEALNNAYVINETVTTSENAIYKFEAFYNRAEILTDKAGLFIDFSNQNKEDGEHHCASSLHYFAMAMDDLKMLSPVDINRNGDYDIEAKIARVYINTSCVFKKFQYFRRFNYEMKRGIAEIIALTVSPLGSEETCVVNSELEEKAHIDKGLELFKSLYQSNPMKYRNFLCSTYLMRSGFYEMRDLFNEAVADCEEVSNLCRLLSDDIEANSGLNKSYIESELRLAHVYMRDKVNQPEKAMPHFENAIKICEDLATKMPDVYEWKLVEIYSETAKAYGSLGKHKEAEEIVFDKSYEVLTRLLDTDNRANDGTWDIWLSIVELCFRMMQQEFNAGILDGKVWIGWINTTWTFLANAFDKWLEAIKEDANILLPAVCRYVDSSGREDFVVKHFQEEYETILCRIVRILSSMFMCYDRKDSAIELVTTAMMAYNTLLTRIVGSSGILRESIYLFEVRKKEYGVFLTIVKNIDNGVYNRVSDEFRNLKALIAFECGNPITNENMNWSDIIKTYENMLSIANSNQGFMKAEAYDIADCFGHLGYAYFMNGEFLCK